MSVPPVSVVMPVHDAAPYLALSIESILRQSFEDLELVVLDNGSTDGSAAVARRYAEADPRGRVFEDPNRLGVAGSSNRAFSHARAELVARMDADDLCRPDRIERQYEVMRSDPDVAVVGTLADGIDAGGRKVRPRDRWRLVRCAEVPLVHGSAMIRRRAFEECGGYSPRIPLATDVELFLRLASYGRIVILPEALYTYRYHPVSVTASTPVVEVAQAKEILQRSLAELRAGRAALEDAEVNGQPPPEALASALYYVGASRLWSGGRPDILGQVVHNEGFELSPAWIRTLAFATWGRVSPATLRAALRALVRARDAAAGVILDGGPVEWRPG